MMSWFTGDRAGRGGRAERLLNALVENFTFLNNDMK